MFAFAKSFVIFLFVRLCFEFWENEPKMQDPGCKQIHFADVETRRVLPNWHFVLAWILQNKCIKQGELQGWKKKKELFSVCSVLSQGKCRINTSVEWLPRVSFGKIAKKRLLSVLTRPSSLSLIQIQVKIQTERLEEQVIPETPHLLGTEKDTTSTQSNYSLKIICFS